MSDAKPECKDPGLLVPVIHLERCEAKADCVRVCPYNVFEVRPITDNEKAALSFFGRVKSFAHGHKKAFAIRAADCHGCGLCVSACPEKAITLKRRDDWLPEEQRPSLSSSDADHLRRRSRCFGV